MAKKEKTKEENEVKKVSKNKVGKTKKKVENEVIKETTLIEEPVKTEVIEEPIIEENKIEESVEVLDEVPIAETINDIVELDETVEPNKSKSKNGFRFSSKKRNPKSKKIIFRSYSWNGTNFDY